MKLLFLTAKAQHPVDALGWVQERHLACNKILFLKAEFPGNWACYFLVSESNSLLDHWESGQYTLRFIIRIFKIVIFDIVIVILCVYQIAYVLYLESFKPTDYLVMSYAMQSLCYSVFVLIYVCLVHWLSKHIKCNTHVI